MRRHRRQLDQIGSRKAAPIAACCTPASAWTERMALGAARIATNRQRRPAVA